MDIFRRQDYELSPLAHLDLNGTRWPKDSIPRYLKQVLVGWCLPGRFLTREISCSLPIIESACWIWAWLAIRLLPCRRICLKLLLAVSEGAVMRRPEIAIRISDTSDHFEETDFRH